MPKLLSPIPAKALIKIGESLTQHRRGSGRVHKGVDLFAAAGTPVVAPISGRVLRVVNGMSGRASQRRAGYFVDEQGEDGHIYRMLHLDSDVNKWVRSGEQVTAGQRIGTVGRVGTSGVNHAKPHLHFEIARADFDSVRSDYGERVDPLQVLPIRDYLAARGIVATMDIDWKGILSTVIDKGSPILGKVVDAYAPGAGAVVAGGLPLVKEYVVQPYVPGTAEAKPVPVASPPAVAATDPKAAEAYLMSRGWTLEQVRQQLQGPTPPGPPGVHPVGEPLAVNDTTTPQKAALIDGVLAQAGWTAEQRAALLRGPESLRTHQLQEAEGKPVTLASREGHQEDIVRLQNRKG